MSDFLEDFGDMLADEIRVRKRLGMTDAHGTASFGAPVPLRARVQRKLMRIRDASGNEVVSGTQIYTEPTPALSPADLVLVTGDVDPLGAQKERRPLRVDPVSDEAAAHHQVVYLN